MNRTGSVAESDWNRVFDALAHQHRRAALSCLVERDERIPLVELAEHVAMVVEPAGNTRNGALIERIAVQLHHSHLPKLGAMGFVEYDERVPRMVGVTRAGRALAALLTPVVRRDSRP